MGISKFESVATSYCPAWLENSWLVLSRRSFSGSTVKLTLMPVCLVKLSAVSFWRSTIWGLLTINTLTLSAPPPLAPPLAPPPPAPEHAESAADTVSTPTTTGVIVLRDIAFSSLSGQATRVAPMLI